MKKIFVYAGSHGGENSNTVRFTKLILDEVCKISGNEIQYKIYTPKNTDINRCVGCINCFINGKCSFSDNDDMKHLQEEMLEADFVIFASPIYMMSVSGDTKIFLDRLAYWSHLMKFCGKPAMALTTSCGNGADYTLDYLYKVMCFMGLKVVEKINANVFSPHQINEDFMKEEVIKCAEIVYNYTMKIEKVKSDKILDTIFNATKRNVLSYKEYPIYEYHYWNDNGYFELETFQDVIDKKDNEA